MNTTIKNILIAALVSIGFLSHAQIKNEKTEQVTVYGNCGMCKKKIEKAGNDKNQAIVDWDRETKLATITYDSVATSSDEILKRIALVGYDSDSYYAPDETYAALPGCCRYDRPKQENMMMESMEMDNHDMDGHMNHEMTTATSQENPLTPVYNSYFELKDALVNTDGDLASQKAKDLSAAISQVNMHDLGMDVHMVWMDVLEPLTKESEQLAQTSDVEKQRSLFTSLSENMYQLLKVDSVEAPVYYQHCPMANGGSGANWLSLDEEVNNPYFGSKMLHCGKTTETIQ